MYVATEHVQSTDLVLHAVLPAVAGSVGAARRMVESAVVLMGGDPGDVVLVTSELVANAVLHVGRGQVVLDVSRRDGVLFVEVLDELPEVVPEIPTSTTDPLPGEDAESGRGLLIAAMLADRLEVTVLGPRKAVAATFEKCGVSV